ncbi:MAG TPA: metallophosphoesterase [Sphingobacteriaceae bacterium]
MKMNHLIKGSLSVRRWHSTHMPKRLKFCMLGALIFAGCDKDLALPGHANKAEKGQDASTSADEYFHMAVLPDTQYYTDPDGTHGGTMQMLTNQLDWIVANKTALEIKYVAHVGDITDNGDRPGHDYEWVNASSQLNRLFTANIPFGLAVGNHDQWCFGDPGSGATNDGYGTYFGKSKFTGKSWYGGAYGSSDNNDNHYDLFTEDGINYLVLYIEFNQQGYAPGSGDCAGQQHYSSTIETNVKNWANGIIAANSGRKVIIVSHSILNPHTTSDATHNAKHRALVGQGPDNLPGTFTTQGQYIYDNIAKPNQNVFMMLSGHVTGEGYRVETQNGHTVKVFLSDYQDRPYGGNGYMRIMKFNKTLNTINVRSIQPLPGANGEELDLDSKFTVSMF